MSTSGRCGGRSRRRWARSLTRSTRRRRGMSSRPARRRSATSSRAFAGRPMRRPCRCGSMRRKPLFPPPADPQTGRAKRNKGRQDFTVLTINGRVQLWRRRWYSPEEGTTAPLDRWLDAAEGTISLGVREMACRLNGDGKNFDKAAANLGRTAQVRLSGETLRVLVEAEGKRVLEAQRSGRLGVDWSASDCRTESGTTRVYFGSDGVTVPMITDAEKVARRQKVKEKRKQQAKGKGKGKGKEARPLPPRRAGADQ